MNSHWKELFRLWSAHCVAVVTLRIAMYIMQSSLASPAHSRTKAHIQGRSLNSRAGI